MFTNKIQQWKIDNPGCENYLLEESMKYYLGTNWVGMEKMIESENETIIVEHSTSDEMYELEEYWDGCAYMETMEFVDSRYPMSLNHYAIGKERMRNMRTEICIDERFKTYHICQTLTEEKFDTNQSLLRRQDIKIFVDTILDCTEGPDYDQMMNHKWFKHSYDNIECPEVLRGVLDSYWTFSNHLDRKIKIICSKLSQNSGIPLIDNFIIDCNRYDKYGFIQSSLEWYTSLIFYHGNIKGDDRQYLCENLFFRGMNNAQFINEDHIVNMPIPCHYEHVVLTLIPKFALNMPDLALEYYIDKFNSFLKDRIGSVYSPSACLPSLKKSEFSDLDIYFDDDFSYGWEQRREIQEFEKKHAEWFQFGFFDSRKL